MASFLEAHSPVIKALESELMEDQGLSLTWYDVLTHLSESEGARLQHQALAGSLLLSRSGVTRLVEDRMAETGLVRREASPEDRRASYVVMTAQGAGMPWTGRRRGTFVASFSISPGIWIPKMFAPFKVFSPGCSKASRKMDVRLEIKTRPTVGDNWICL